MPLATQIANPAGARDAKYSLAGLQKLSDGTYTDGVYRYDDSGYGINRPNSTVSGLPSALNDEQYNVYTGATGGGGGGGGGDLLSLALSSPYYQQVLAANRAAEQAAAAARKAALQQMLIQFGLIPEGFKDPYGDIDQTTRDLAAANTTSGISASARLKQALQDAQRGSVRNLTARGLRRSGTRGYQLRKNQLGYDQSYSDAVQQLLSGANSLYSNFAQGQYNRATNLSSALANAIASLNFGANGPSIPTISPPSAPSAPTYTAPGFQPGNPTIPTGGGYYTNPQTGDLTEKWKKIGTMF